MSVSRRVRCSRMVVHHFTAVNQKCAAINLSKEALLPVLRAVERILPNDKRPSGPYILYMCMYIILLYLYICMYFFFAWKKEKKKNPTNRCEDQTRRDQTRATTSHKQDWGGGESGFHWGLGLIESFFFFYYLCDELGPFDNSLQLLSGRCGVCESRP